MRIRLAFASILVLSTALHLASCGRRLNVESGLGGPAQAVATPFRAYWEAGGGEAFFGEPIGPARSDGNLTRQVFTNVELLYDPSAPRDDQIRLAPLGRSLGLAEPPVPPPADSFARYFPRTGHSVYTGFLQRYDELGGEAVAGAPIGEVRFEAGRILQYFENLGLYRDEDSPPSSVGLLAFGLAAAGGAASGGAGADVVLRPNLHGRPFAEFLERSGGEAFFGQSLTEPYAGSDGGLEQVFERAVLFGDPRTAEETRLRPLGLELGPASPEAPPSSAGGGLYFPVTGHNVLDPFADFYRESNGWQLLGLPLDEATTQGDRLIQRFENGILEYWPEMPSAWAIQLAPLGRSYLESLPAPTPSPQAPTPFQGPTATATPVAVRTWVEFPLLPPGESQRVYIVVVRADGMPWEGVIPIVEVQGPRSAFLVNVPPTDEQGLSAFDLDVDGLRPGEIVNYEVVVTGEHGIGYAIGQFAAKFGD